MFAELTAIAGVWFVVACAAEFAAALIEQAGAARAPEEDHPRSAGAVALMAVASLLTPGLLLAHGFFATQGQADLLRVWAMGLPVAAAVGGAIVGAVLGAIVPAARAPMRKLALPLALAALAVTVFASLPTITLLIEAARNGGVLLHAF